MTEGSGWTMGRLKDWYSRRDPNTPNPDPTGWTVPCDGKCGCEDPHTAHLAPDWESKVSTLSAPVEQADPIAHPAHYTSHPSGIECIDIVEHMNFNMGCAVKYLFRADYKGKPLEDLKKARWYVEREIARREREK